MLLEERWDALEALLSNPKRFQQPQEIFFMKTQHSGCGSAIPLRPG